MDQPSNFTGPKDPLGHVRQMSVRGYGRDGCVIALECSCGSVFAQGRFPVDDVACRELIYEEGRERALEHVCQARAVLCGGQS